MKSIKNQSKDVGKGVQDKDCLNKNHRDLGSKSGSQAKEFKRRARIREEKKKVQLTGSKIETQ